MSPIVARSLLGLAWVGVAPAALGQEPPLYPGERFDCLADAWDSVVADLDGDGHLDLAVCGGNGYTLVLRRGDGVGGLGPPIPTFLGGTGVCLAAGRVDGDANVDLVVSVSPWLGGDPSVEVLLGDGQGGFTSGGALATGPWETTDLLLADLDADGDDDLLGVSVPHYTYVPWIWTALADGQGGFGTPMRLGSLASPGGLGTGDLDGDGRLDLVVSLPLEGAIAVLRGDGLGGFGAPRRHAAGGQPGEVELGDLDGDGDLDTVLLETGPVGRVLVMRNDGTGHLAPSQAYPAGRWPVRVELADVDGDGLLDVGVARAGDSTWNLEQGTLALLRNRGDGTLGSPIGWHAGEGALSLAQGDLDEDGTPDWVFGGETSWVTVLLGDPLQGLAAMPPLAAGAGPESAPRVARAADLDADGYDDLVAANADEGGVAVHMADGNGGFRAPTAIPTGVSPSDVQVADLDGDAHLDLLVADEGDDEVVVLRGDGAGGFVEIGRHAVADTPRSIALGDVDGDGDLDALVACRLSNRLCVLLGDGKGGLTSAPAMVTVGGPEEVVAADLDRDGWLDCVLACRTGKAITVRLGDGNGGFVTKTTVSLPGWPVSVAVRDLDRDGRLDVLVGQDEGPAVMVLLGDGMGGLGSPASFLETETARSLVAGDVDGDGLVDVAVVTGKLSQVWPRPLRVLRGDCQGGFTTARAFVVGREPSRVTLGDLDGDGNLDLVVANAGSHDLTVLRNQLPPATACSDQVPYCRAKTNSSGCLPRICSSGSPTLSGPDDFAITADGVLTHELGLLLWSLAPASTPFGGGTLCVGGPVTRAWVASSGGPPGVNDCGGAYAFPVSQAYMASKGLAAGTQVFAQVWMRDPLLPPPFPYALTNGLAFTIAP